MNIRKIIVACIILSVSSLVFYLGYLFGNREFVDAQDDTITVIGPNLSVQNSLSKIDIRTINGVVDTDTIGSFGQMFYKYTENNETELLFRLENVNKLIQQKENKQQKQIPSQLEIVLCRRSFDRSDYDFEKIGSIALDASGDQQVAEFSTITESSLADVERIWFRSEDPDDVNLFIDSSSDLPLKQRGKPAPYFWVII